MEIDLRDPENGFNEKESVVLSGAMDVAETGDVFRLLDTLHHIAAKLALASGVTDESVIAGQARHIAILRGIN